MNYLKLLRSEEVLENVFAIYGTINSEQFILGINGKLLKLIDIEPDLLIGQKFIDLVFWQTDALNVENLKNAFKVVLEKGFANTSLKFRINAKKTRHIDLNLSVNSDEKNSVEEIFFCATDITARVREVEFFKERSEHFLYAAEKAGIGLWFWDLINDEIFSTPRCNELLDLAPYDILTYEHFLNTLHPDDRTNVETKLLDSQKREKEYNVEYRVIHSDGNIQWVSAKGNTFFDENLQAISMMGSVRRITDEKMASEELEKIYAMEKRAREEAIKANKAKDYFLALVSHELRSPLNSILGWTQILAKKKVDEKTFNKAIETIERSARSQAKLIDDLVDSARVTSGKLKLELRPVNLHEVIKQVISSHQPTAANKSITLEYLSNTEQVEIYGDLIRLQQIFINLLTNAIKFTSADGHISVNLIVDIKQVTVIIKDTGQGINENDLPYIFDRFAQGDNKTTIEKKGLGLGLSIARILTEKQKGKISAESEGLGKGATFKVTFPLYLEGDERNTNEIIEDQNISNEGILNNLNILVVEDDDDSRNVLELYLEQIGANVISAESVITALEKLNMSEYKFDVIVSDLAMPDEDGYSLIKKVRQSSVYGHIPAIALSAFTARDNKQKAFELGFQKYHTKPFEPDILVKEIIEVIQKQVSFIVES